MNETITIMVVDDNELLRFGLAGSINVWPGIKLVGDAAGSEEALKLYGQVNPDVVIMDYRMPGGSGVECSRKILKIDPDAKIILFSHFESEETIWEAVQAGVRGYLAKTAGAVEDVMEAISEVSQGRTFFPAKVRAKLESRKAQEELSKRELEILQKLSEGCSNRDLEDYFGISLPTVKFHIKNLREKLGASDRTDAVAKAYKKGILKLDP